MWVDTAHPQNGREPRIANKFKAIRDIASFKDEGLAALTRDAEAMLEATSQAALTRDAEAMLEAMSQAALTRDAEAMLEATSQIDKIAQEILSKLQKPTSEHAESEDH